MNFFEKLLDIILGGVPGFAAALMPDDQKKRVLARLGDYNPFNKISANHDLIRALRLSWIEAALKVLDTAKRTAESPDWAGNRETILQFEKLTRRKFKKVRNEAFDRMKDLSDSPIDIHIHAIMEGIPKYITPGNTINDAKSSAGITASFSGVVSIITGWPENEVPDIFGQIARQGLPTQGDNSTRDFTELVFAAFTDLIKSPERYPEAGRAFDIAIAQMARALSEAIFTAIHVVDDKMDKTLEGLDTLKTLQDGAEKHLKTLPKVISSVDRIEDGIDKLNKNLDELIKRKSKNNATSYAISTPASLMRSKPFSSEILNFILPRIGDDVIYDNFMIPKDRHIILYFNGNRIKNTEQLEKKIYKKFRIVAKIVHR